MFRLLVALVVCGMAFSESVQDWIAKGTRAYAEMKLDESAANFKKAVELWYNAGFNSIYVHFNRVIKRHGSAELIVAHAKVY